VSNHSALLETLVSRALPMGGWGYAPDQEAHLEPTCLALLALRQHSAPRFQDVWLKALGWIQSCRRDDGTYRLQRGRPEAVWATGLVVFLEAAHSAVGPGHEQSVTALLGVEGRAEASAADGEDINDIDSRLVGWPWAENNFSWVEPTSWAVLALRRAGRGEHPRVLEGQKLLLDRTLPEGGLNYGNRRIFGVPLEPIPGPTALALLALQGSDDPRVGRSVAYLCGQAATNVDLEHLCWIRLALDLHRGFPGVPEALDVAARRIREAHEERLANPWVRPTPLREALTVLALGIEQGNPFRIPADLKQGAGSPAKKLPLTRPSLGEWVQSSLQGITLKALNQLRPLPPRSAVHIAPVNGYNDNIVEVLARQYDSFREQVPLKGKRVVLKPNLVEYHRDKVINTHPHVVAGVIELCQREGAAEVLVAEGPGHWRNVEYLVAASGLGDVLRHYQVPFVDLNHDEPVKRPNQGRLTGLSHLYLSRTIANAEVVISLPKLKTHHWAVATLSLKNLFGTLPGICYGWPKNELHWRGIDNSIVDIALTRTPDLAIVDGIVGMEGDGPLNGTPKEMGVLIMGSDLVAVDATCCRLMQLDPSRVGYLVLGHRKKLGLLQEEQIEQLGETIAGRARPFETVAHFQPLYLGRGA
jgi:uncharacterized protein (DUF362 family)